MDIRLSLYVLMCNYSLWLDYSNGGISFIECVSSKDIVFQDNFFNLQI